MKKCLVILFLLLPAALAAAQDWDEVLDRYEIICGRCAELKSEADAGGNVTQSAIISLSGQLEQLKTILQQGEEKMTPAQEARFRQIKAKFTLLMTGRAPETVDTLSRQEKWDETIREVESVREDAPASSGDVQNSIEAETGKQPDRHAAAQPASIRGLHTDLLLEVGAMPFSAGILAAVTYGRWGGFIKGRSGFHYPKTAYLCTSDGVISDTGGRIWATGRTQSTRLSITAGPVVRACGWLSVYAGAGYGISGTAWEDTDGRWVKVSDRSFDGAEACAGLIFSIRRVSLNIGLGTVGFKCLDGELGIGVNF